MKANINRVGTRRITSRVYNFAKTVMPKISETEKAALNAGTVGFDRDIFGGSPKLSDLDRYKTFLSEEESAFLKNEVDALCEILDDYSITEKRDFDRDFWDRCKSQGFFGMIIPKEYGGKGFSAHAHSQVVMKISTRSTSAAATVTVPNSLGPGELLVRYGTDTQKNYFLPKLAKGELIPCFALTSPHSGSDAASMAEARGTVVKGPEGDLQVIASFNKRYITLAPVAGVFGVAFHLDDPNNLLGGSGSPGITIALLERDHEGLQMGKRHDPLMSSIMNGPVVGKDVVIRMDQIIGGQERCGFGWNMLMDCLSEGRAVSLPASAVGGAKMSLNGAGAYSRLRKQFKVPIASMGGIQEVLARIAADTYILTAAQQLVNSMLIKHEQPAVISGIMKYETTSRTRQVGNDAMDILAGAGICRGKGNIAANSYMSIPMAVTVEGANILTRSMIIYGQGLNRSHPYLIHIIDAIQKGDAQQEFNDAVWGMIGHGFNNAILSISRGIIAPRQRKNSSNILDYYEAQLQRLAANFAVCSDLSLCLGGKLKFEEMVSGRFADALGTLYLGYASLWFYKQHKDVEGIECVFEIAMESLLQQNQQALVDLSRNFPVRGVGFLMRNLCFPIGSTSVMYNGPTDALRKKVADTVSRPCGVRDLLSEGVFISKDPEDKMNMLNAYLPKAVQLEAIMEKARSEKRVLSASEIEFSREVESVVDKIIQVDTFDGLGHEHYQDKSYVRPALRGTKFSKD